MAAALVLVACGKGTGHGAANEDSGSKRDAATPATMFLLPSHLPAGFAVGPGQLVTQGRAEKAFAAAVGRVAASSGYDHVVFVLVSAASTDRQVAANEKSQPVDVNGITARLSDSPLTGAAVDWFANGLSVAVLAAPGLSIEVVAVARRLRLPDAGDPDHAEVAVPDGMATIASSHVETHAPEAGSSLDLVGPDQARVTVRLIATEAPPQLTLGLADHLARVRVRGHDGWAATAKRTIKEGIDVNTTAVGWREHSGQVVTVSGHTSLDQLRPIIEGLRHVSETEWRAALPTATTSRTPTPP